MEWPRSGLGACGLDHDGGARCQRERLDRGARAPGPVRARRAAASLQHHRGASRSLAVLAPGCGGCKPDRRDWGREYVADARDGSRSAGRLWACAARQDRAVWFHARAGHDQPILADASAWWTGEAVGRSCALDRDGASPGSGCASCGQRARADGPVDVAGHRLGCFTLRPLDAHGRCELKRLYVAPQGRGIGLGRRLVEAILREAERIGYREMRLDTLPSMAEALAVYRRAGFEPMEPYYTDSGRWTRVEDSWVVGERIGWCAVSHGGEPWRGLLLI